MSYGLNQNFGTGLLSLLQNYGNKGTESNKEFKSFIDKDTGTEHHVAKTGRQIAGAVSDTDFDYLKDKPINVKELQEKFAKILGTLELNDQAQVIKAWSLSDEDGKTNIMNMIVDNPAFATSYAIQNEQPIRNLGIGY